MNEMLSPSLPDRPEALSILIKASSLVLHAGSEEILLAKILDLASNLLVADAYGIWRESEDRLGWRVLAHRGLSGAYPKTFLLDGKTFPGGVWVVGDMATDERVPFHPSIYEREGISSAMIVPWVLDSTSNGAMVYYWRSARQFSPDDTRCALALSNLSASALNRLELNEQNRREKQRLSFLAEASAMLASSLDYESTLERVARLVVSHMAEWCTVHVAENGRLARLVVAHADPGMAGFAEEYERRYPEQIETDRGVGKVFSTGTPEIVSSITEEMLDAAAQDDEHRHLLQQLQLSSSIVVPLKSREKTLGVIRLLATKGRYFGDRDVELALDLAQRAAVAIENAQLHHALLEQAAELKLSHAAAKMGSWTWDLENGRLSWSSEFKALHGLREDAEPTGEAGYELVHPEDRELAHQAFWATLQSSASVFNSEHRTITPDGRILWLQVRGRIRRNQSGKATWIAGLIIDVTESRMAEQALRRAEKLAAAGRLAATVAHEVNNPLEALVNAIYLAQHVEGLPQEAADHLCLADSELRRMTHIVRQTLGFYRESTLPQSTGILQLVSEVLDLYRSRSNTRGLTLRTSGNLADELFVTVIAGEIKQVVANLVANAIDATPPGGLIETSVLRFEDTVEIVVMDTGSGISEGNRKHLFEPFFTTKSDVGTGLGLWVSKGIVEKHGGSIVIDDAGEQGTTFRVRLPIRTG
ncbi:ATP-binding protein [Granulicella pectinivorans]|nr:ATP-binding protein [Granulicella pectinivorans]